MKKLIWLDDCRDPKDTDVDWMMFSCLGRNCQVFWLKSYDEFTSWILKNGLPEGINFDHDLSDVREIEKTGMDCAKWVVEYCLDNNLKFPLWYTHSANPTGRENINKYITNFIKFQQ